MIHRYHNRPWIIMDLDDTVTDFGPTCYRLFQQHLGVQADFDDLLDYNMHTHMGHQFDRWMVYLDQLRVIDLCKPYGHWLPVLLSAVDRGYCVGWITARARITDARTRTLLWLAAHGFPVDGLWITDPAQCKSQVMPQHVVRAYDDSPVHCTAYAEAGVPYIGMPVQKWNRDHDHSATSSRWPQRIVRAPGSNLCADLLSAIQLTGD